METVQNRNSKFEALFKQYYKAMLAAALRILGNTRDAEDAVQQAGESLLKNINKIGKVDTPETCSYVVLTAERKALDIIKKRSNRREVSMEETAERGVPLNASVDDPLQEAIAKLPARYRQVIMLRFGMGYSAREVAKIMELSHENTKKLILRAKEQLKEDLKQKGETIL